MENDDGKRPRKGVVITLLVLEDGTSRLIMDDVSSGDLTRDTYWKHQSLFTQKRLPSKDVIDMALSEKAYQEIGESLIARLLALNAPIR